MAAAVRAQQSRRPPPTPEQQAAAEAFERVFGVLDRAGQAADHAALAQQQATEQARRERNAKHLAANRVYAETLKRAGYNGWLGEGADA
jgi:NAD-dependent oxidoreductase involved in siderophore biosynthesis